MTISPEIQELWNQHSSSPFPKGYGRTEIQNVDLALLDAEIAGCIHMYIHNDGKLDYPRIKFLRQRLIDLNNILLLLDREELIYFDRLRALSHLILQEVETH
jgi:hypothetical protein